MCLLLPEPMAERLLYREGGGSMNEEKTIKVFCKDCQFCEYETCNGNYHCRSMRGLYRTVEAEEYCSWGEALLDE